MTKTTPDAVHSAPGTAADSALALPGQRGVRVLDLVLHAACKEDAKGGAMEALGPVPDCTAKQPLAPFQAHALGCPGQAGCVGSTMANGVGLGPAGTRGISNDSGGGSGSRDSSIPSQAKRPEI